MRRAQTTAGFTMIELMIVVAIIGVMAAAIMPSMSDVLADHRQAAATMDVVRISRKARALTMSSGVAHTLRFRPGNNQLGMIELLRGATPRCRQTTWAQAFTRPLETLAMAQYNATATGVAPSKSDHRRHVILLEALVAGNAQNTVAICYQPSGDTYVSPDDAVTFTRQADTSPITLTVRGMIDNAARGMAREVMFEAGDTARVR